MLDIYQHHKIIIVFDVETTGLSATDKILQLTILNGNGSTLFSSYIKPENRKHWPIAQRVNHITYGRVKDCPTFPKVRKEIQKIFNKAKLIVGYNVDFDLRFIKQSGIIVNPLSEIFCVMKEYGHFKAIDGDYKRYKLTVCAKNYGYTYNAHDSDEDTSATLYCFEHLMEEQGYIWS